jgi:demethylmenaquinone methyltransferase/2-methoxy-6-polyprenyl-1,4-benzoquinol methylase
VPGCGDHPILAEQLAYYRARAREYDKWFRREGLHDLGEELNARWRSELDAVYSALDAFAPRGDVLELAYGTGEWTVRLAEFATRVVGVDAAPEMRDLALAKLQEAGKRNVELVVDDLFAWRPDQDYDVVFFAFWLSHVPASQGHRFWRSVHDALRPGGRFFFVDAARAVVEGNVLHGSRPPDRERATELRRLEDGREFRIVKRSFDPDRLVRDLREHGLDASVVETGEFFVYGVGHVRGRTTGTGRVPD